MLKLTQEEKQWAGQALSRFEQKLAAVRGRSAEKNSFLCQKRGA